MSNKSSSKQDPWHKSLRGHALLATAEPGSGHCRAQPPSGYLPEVTESEAPSRKPHWAAVRVGDKNCQRKPGPVLTRVGTCVCESAFQGSLERINSVRVAFAHSCRGSSPHSAASDARAWWHCIVARVHGGAGPLGSHQEVREEQEGAGAHHSLELPSVITNRPPTRPIP